jgi:hypothetical protein
VTSMSAIIRQMKTFFLGGGWLCWCLRAWIWRGKGGVERDEKQLVQDLKGNSNILSSQSLNLQVLHPWIQPTADWKHSEKKNQKPLHLYMLSVQIIFLSLFLKQYSNIITYIAFTL